MILQMQPIIGITVKSMTDDSAGASAQSGCEMQGRQILSNTYIHAVRLAGGMPIMLPILPDAENAPLLLTRLDGIIFSGGSDISPILYGENASGALGTVCYSRDVQELALMRAALELQLPILGICRGCQLLNVALGGTLVQHIDDKKQGEHVFSAHLMDNPTHWISTVAGSRIAGILGAQCAVNSFHHQCVKQPGTGVEITAVDAHGVPECIEVPTRSAFTMGVQWHPEGMAAKHPQQVALLQTLVKAASNAI